MIKVRPAVPGDIEGIMKVEEESFGSLGTPKDVLAECIILCNAQQPGWFWVVEDNGVIKGDIILQPTDLKPEDCTSWFAATDDGTLKRTFKPNGSNVYVASLACSASAIRGTSTLLMHASLVRWTRHGGLYMFLSRMPGFRKMHRRNGISPEAYWQLKHRHGGPRDSMMRLYWQMGGEIWPRKLLEKGYSVDEESGGYAVLFVFDDPIRATLATAGYLYDDGLAAQTGKK